MPASTSEADIVLNRANVSLAKLQRLIASSLPPRGEDETTHTKTDAETEREEEAIFTPEQDGVGLGFHIPDSNTTSRHSISNDTLRKKLLGSGRTAAAQKRGTGAHVAHGVKMNKFQNLPPSKPRPRVPARVEAEDEEEEEEGRGSLGKSKRRRVETPKEEDTNTGHEDGRLAEDGRARKTGKATSGSYLDEVLSERAKKGKKKKKKKGLTPKMEWEQMLAKK